MAKKALKGFANLKLHELDANTAAAYTPSTTTALVGAQSCERDDTRNDYTIKADDDVYDAGSEFEKTELTITVAEMELDMLAKLTGSTYTSADKLMDELTTDAAPEVALSFSGLRADGGYRMFRYYCAKLTKYKHSLKTRGTDNGINAYELTFACVGRKCDKKLRTTKDVDMVGTTAPDITWLDTLPAVPTAG